MYLISIPHFRSDLTNDVEHGKGYLANMTDSSMSSLIVLSIK